MSTIFDKAGVAYDGTDAAARAIHALRPMLTDLNAEVHLIMVFDQHLQNELQPFADSEHLTLGDAAELAGQRLASELRGAGLKTSHAIVQGSDVIDGIMRGASEAGCTSLIVPTHHMGTMTRWFTGNLRDKMVGASALPILVMPPAG